MKKICISAMNERFFNYGFNMFSSFRHFHPNVECICCDFGLNKKQVEILKKINVEIIKIDCKIKNLRCTDMLVYEFLRDKSWDKILWADSDIIFLSNIDEVFQHSEQVVAVPGRNKNGLIHYTKNFLGYLENDNFLYFSTALWVTSSKDFLYEMSQYLIKHPETTFDCIPFTKIVNQHYTNKHLDGNIYNFGRDLVPYAKIEKNKVFYEYNGQRFYPKLVHFSSCDDGERKKSEVIKNFFKRNIEARWQIKML